MWLEGAAQQGFQNHTDETKQLHAVLPQRADGAADALQQQQQHIALGLLDRDAVILDRTVDILQQRLAGFRQRVGAARQALGA
ncbi:hypothetical protein D9M71_773610 [compost metagenome]